MMNDLVPALKDLIHTIATEDIQLMISVAVIFATLFMVWLLLRGIRLWYWKVNDSAGMLRKIDRRLKKIEKQMSRGNVREYKKKPQAAATDSIVEACTPEEAEEVRDEKDAAGTAEDEINAEAGQTQDNLPENGTDIAAIKEAVEEDVTVSAIKTTTGEEAGSSAAEKPVTEAAAAVQAAAKAIPAAANTTQSGVAEIVKAAEKLAGEAARGRSGKIYLREELEAQIK